MHGYFYNNQCFCSEFYQGEKCEKTKVHGWYMTDDDCLYLIERLDHLLNITPDHYENEDDDEFSRFSANTIEEVQDQDQYQFNREEIKWIKMHEMSEDFKIFEKDISPKSIKQGSLGNCYFLAVLASISNIRNGQIIRDIFQTKNDNSKHVYVTRWFIIGKPRYVAVDDWIPGEGKQPQFSQLSNKNEFWPIILEKAWAKINGNYMKTRAGVPQEILQILTSARTHQFENNLYDSNYIFSLFKSYLEYGYPILATPYTREDFHTNPSIYENKLQLEHQYSVLKAFEVQLDNGQTQKLIQIFNPWNREDWVDNPWGGNGENWSESMKKKYDVNPMDGAFHLTPEDYMKEFVTTEFCELRQNYDIFWQEITLNQKNGTYYAEFILNQGLNRDIFLYFNNINYRLIDKEWCSSPFFQRSNSFKVITPQNYEIIDQYNHKQIQVQNSVDGKYQIQVQVIRKDQIFEYFTFSIYAPTGTIQFLEKGDKNQEVKEKNCPNGCNGKGKCNTKYGKCYCYYGYEDKDCSKRYIPCKNNCNDNGKCNTETGVCECQPRTFEKDCKSCKDQINCQQDVIKNRCQIEKGQWAKYMERNCAQSCSEQGIKKFASCLKK